MGRLKIGAADLRARDVRRDRQHRHARPVAVEEAVDQVEITGTATARADRELSGEMRLGAGREGRGLLVAHVHPLDFLLPAQMSQ
jgi:hypothetical protein